MRKLTIKKKIILWFAIAIFVLSAASTALTFVISRSVLDQSIQERLIEIVEYNADEIEFNNSLSSVDKEPSDFYISYNGGVLEIDDDFCDYLDGVCTALIDKDNFLIYGETPFHLDKESAFSFTSVGTIEHRGQKYYIYEKPLTGNNLNGLWLRGFISENEVVNILYNVARISLWFIPLFGVFTLLGGYVLTRRSFAPIEKISNTAKEISESGDLSRRIDLKAGEDELHQLAQTYNKMFERLEKTFNAEKQFTSDASHELRTPMAVIKAQCEYALQFAESEDDYKEALEVIQRQNDRMSSLLSQLLFFTRLENRSDTFKLVETDLSQLVASIGEERRILLDDSSELTLDVESGIKYTIDESLMSRLVINLLDNAFKYSPDHPCVSLSLKESESQITLSVSDRGQGITEENLEKIWNRFYQEDSSRNEEGSFGLGLSMVKEIAAFHGGQMSVQSSPGTGSTFTLTLPKKI